MVKVGIIGLPNVGKSTLFKALTGQAVNISNYPFCTIKPNFGIALVPDPKLEKFKAPKITPAAIQFVDIAGLVKGAHQGKGLGNEFLSHIESVDAIIHLVRVFEDPDIAHIEGDINPARDIKIIKKELKAKNINKPELIIYNDKKEFNAKQIIKDAFKLLDLITFYTFVGKQELRAWPIKRGTTALEAAGRVHSDFQEKFIKAIINNQTRGKDYEIQDGDMIEFKI